MPDEQDPPPIYAHTFGSLTHQEQSDLTRRAMDNQEIFDQLWDAAELREVSRDPAVRRRLLAALQEPPRKSFWAAIRQAIVSPAGRLILAGAMLACIAFLLLYHRGQPTDETLSLVTSPESDLSLFFQLPARNPAGLRVDLSPPKAGYRPGDIAHATVYLKQPAAVFALRLGPDGTRVVLPPDLASSADRTAPDISFAFDPSPPTEDIRRVTRYTLQVMALPPGTDIRTQSIRWASLGRNAYSVVRIHYNVAP